MDRKIFIIITFRLRSSSAGSGRKELTLIHTQHVLAFLAWDAIHDTANDIPGEVVDSLTSMMRAVRSRKVDHAGEPIVIPCVVNLVVVLGDLRRRWHPRKLRLRRSHLLLFVPYAVGDVAKAIDVGFLLFFFFSKKK